MGRFRFFFTEAFGSLRRNYFMTIAAVLTVLLSMTVLGVVIVFASNVDGLLKDLKGKSVSSGSPGSGQWQLLGDLLEAHGMTRKDIGEDLSSFTQSVDKIKDGNLVASLITAGAPTSSISDLANAREVRVVPNQVLPVAPLPDSAFAPCLAACRLILSRGHRAGKFGLDQPPAG